MGFCSYSVIIQSRVGVTWYQSKTPALFLLSGFGWMLSGQLLSLKWVLWKKPGKKNNFFFSTEHNLFYLETTHDICPLTEPKPAAPQRNVSGETSLLASCL